jgi:hypothetical protein
MLSNTMPDQLSLYQRLGRHGTNAAVDVYSLPTVMNESGSQLDAVLIKGYYVQVYCSTSQE